VTKLKERATLLEARLAVEREEALLEMSEWKDEGKEPDEIGLALVTPPGPMRAVKIEVQVAWSGLESTPHALQAHAKGVPSEPARMPDTYAGALAAASVCQAHETAVGGRDGHRGRNYDDEGRAAIGTRGCQESGADSEDVVHTSDDMGKVACGTDADIEACQDTRGNAESAQIASKGRFKGRQCLEHDVKVMRAQANKDKSDVFRDLRGIWGKLGGGMPACTMCLGRS